MTQFGDRYLSRVALGLVPRVQALDIPPALALDRDHIDIPGK
jgi:hypothetical protein